MWRMSNPQALIFIAVVVIAVAMMLAGSLTASSGSAAVGPIIVLVWNIGQVSAPLYRRDVFARSTSL
jgi:type IV secretory pathway TrbF-like protein